MSKKKVISTVSLKSAQKKSQNAQIKYLNKLINENTKKRNTSISVDFDINSAVLAFYKDNGFTIHGSRKISWTTTTV